MGFQQIVVPYNFIPLSSWVFHPDWAEDTFHDVPFSDGLSGRIDYELKNYSPMCVGHAVKDEKTSEGVKKHLIWETDPEGHLVIPGSSIKGMLRTALEIVSFGRMQFFYDRKHAFRLSIGDVKGPNSPYDLIPVFLRPRSEDGGWEYFEVDYIPDNKPVCASVTAKDLSKLLGMSKEVIEGASATEKFEFLYKKLGLSEDAPMPLLHAKLEPRIDYSKAQRNKEKEEDKHPTTWNTPATIGMNADGDTNCVGMFLFMNKNIANDGKGKEKANRFTDYFFYVWKKENLDNKLMWKPLNKDLVDDLNQSLPLVKADSDGVKDDNLYNFNHSHMNAKYGFPVWYLKSKNGSRGDALGFCQVMRRNRSFSVGELVKKQCATKNKDDLNRPDLSDLMFGYLDDKNKVGAGSRVGFSDLRSINVPKIEKRTYVLGEPKSTFYPQYLGRFERCKQYEEGSLLAGRKLYKIRDKLKLADPKFPNENTNVRTAIDFAENGTVFKGSIVFNNLRPAELGALLWVMSFGKGLESDTCEYYHALGHAKPMGAGAIKFKLTPDSIDIPEYFIRDGMVMAGGLNCGKGELIDKCITKFAELMNFEYPFGKPEEYTLADNRWGTSVIMTSYLNNAKEDNNALPDKVYNEFSEEFAIIKKDYENSADAREYKGSYPDGKKFGDACKSYNAEKDYDIQKIMDKRRTLKEQEEQKVQQQAEKAKKEAMQKDMANHGYQEIKSSGNFVKLFVFSLVNADAKEMLNNDLSAGVISTTWKYGTINQLLKSIAADPDYKDESSLNQVADDIIEVVDANSDAKAELKKIAKDGRNKPLMKPLMERLYEKLQ